MDITLEHFDKSISNLLENLADVKSVMVTKDDLAKDLDKLEGKLVAKINPFSTSR